MNINSFIDYTNLQMDATIKDIEKLCDEAKKYHFTSVCVSPYYVPFAKKALEESIVEVTTVVGFPLGMNTKEVKVYEAIEAVNEGADEIDMVINIGRLKDMDYEYIKNEISEIRNITKNLILKVIIETCYLSMEEIKLMTEICSELKVNYIKTSTGFGERGASIEDIDIMNNFKSDNLKIKASGGIRSYKEALDMINHGASRIGTSKGVKIMEERMTSNETI